jgi:transposase
VSDHIFECPVPSRAGFQHALFAHLGDKAFPKCALALDLFEQHPDQAISRSLPGVGDILAPALLAHFGDDRDRSPTAESVQALAGTCPVTAQSGKRRIITFRTACDHRFRDIVQQWAKASLTQSV